MVQVLSVVIATATSVVMPAIAAALPVRPAIVAPTSIGDAYVLQRKGLIPLPNAPAPRFQASPLFRGVGGALMTTPQGQLQVLGNAGWVYRGPDLRHLSVAGWIGQSKDRLQTLPTEDGGFVISSDEDVEAVGPDLMPRWSTPTVIRSVLAGPVAIAPGIVYVLGGTQPSVLDLGTGALIAPLDGIPPGILDFAVAPDGSLRSIVPQAGRASLVANGPDGRVRWSVPLNADRATTPSIGSDGTTYLGVWSGGQGRIVHSGALVAVSADGGILWRARIGRQPARPAIDRHGFVWTATYDGMAYGVSPAGQVAYSRVLGLGPPSSGRPLTQVSALGDGVLVQDGHNSVQLAARPASPGRVVPSLRIADFRLREQPFTCVAPPEGRPRTCLYALISGGQARVRIPTDGVATLTIRRVGNVRVLARQGPYRVLAGLNLIRIHGFLGHEPCAAFRICFARPGRYLLETRVVMGPGRASVLRSTFRLIRSSGVVTAEG